jgi:hypothetical protein
LGSFALMMQAADNPYGIKPGQQYFEVEIDE